VVPAQSNRELRKHELPDLGLDALCPSASKPSASPPKVSSTSSATHSAASMSCACARSAARAAVGVIAEVSTAAAARPIATGVVQATTP